MNSLLLVMTHCPDQASAVAIAEKILHAKLAACVNVLPEIRSLYTWNGQQEDQSEIPLQIKTCVAAYSALQALITEHHPYDVPEIIAVPVVHASEAYAKWVQQETTGY
ncbi:divalent-cation tolerance protein CutA [Undibacterium sp. SXout7W]|uniref:divalent-cation tolerance protein CutA n=1 Tax=Undibacterium sp. SXout7W TaxID=3413049 RepID=UPI003BF15F1A